MTKKTFMAAIIVMLLSTMLAGAPQTKAVSKTIIVPDDYPTIQAAISNATAGDTVFVKSGIYNSTMQSPILIDKPLSLIGENVNSVIIQQTGSFYTSDGGAAVGLAADDVTVSGFTIIKSAIGLAMGNFNGCRVTGNTIAVSGTGIAMTEDCGSIICGNIITGSVWGIELQLSNNSVIYENLISACKANGIITAECRNVTITGNNITDGKISAMTDPDIVATQGGINLGGYGPFYVYGNNITDNQGYGIQFADGCSNAIVHHNNINRNAVGVNVKNFAFYNDFGAGSGNSVYNNNIINNNQNAMVEQTFPYNISDVEHAIGNGTDTIFWDNGAVGNYWSDYYAKYSNATEVGFTGIGNTPYFIDSSNIDHYPLTKTVTVPEFPSSIILPLATISVLLAISALKKKRKILTNC